MKAGLWLMVAIFAIASSSAPAVAQDKQEPAKSHAVLKGTLIGLAAGVAGGALFFGLTNCHYGSDSGAAMVGCGAVTGGIIAGGGIIGHMIGHRIEKRGATPASTTNSSGPWRAPEFVRVSTAGLDLGLPRSPSARATDVFSAATGRSSLTNSNGAHPVLHEEGERLSANSLSVLSGVEGSAAQKRSWIESHPGLFGATVGFSAGFDSATEFSDDFVSAALARH